MKQKPHHESWLTVLRRWVKFNTVGAIGVGVQLVTLMFLKSGLRFHYLVATFLAVETAILHNFTWHEHWTWAERTRFHPGEMFARLLRFNLTTGALSILGNLVLMRILVGQAHLHYLFANMLTIASMAILNFLISDRFVFRASPWRIAIPDREVHNEGAFVQSGEEAGKRRKDEGI